MSPFQPSPDSNSRECVPATITLPYNTTSQQAIDTLGTKLAILRSNSTRQAAQNEHSQKFNKSKAKIRFTSCVCGGSADLYDDACGGKTRNTSQKKAVSIVQERIELHVRSNGSLEVGEVAGKDPMSKRPEASSTQSMDQTSKSCMPGSPEGTQSSTLADDNCSAASQSPQAQVLTAIRLDKAQPNRISTSNINNSSSGTGRNPTHRLATQTGQHLIDHVDAINDLQTPLRQLAPLPSTDEERSSDQISSNQMRSKRRGGFITSSSEGILPVIDVEEPSMAVLSDDDDEDGDGREDLVNSETPSLYTSLVSSPARHSVASSASIYSTASPYIHSPWIPQHLPLGRSTMGVTPQQSSLHHMHSFTAPTDRSSQTSSIATTSDQSDSEADSCSVDSSSRESPPMGDVLSYFPKLLGMDQQATNALLHFTSSPCPSSEIYEDDDLSSRINTFGPSRRQINHSDLQSDLDSPARTNTFIYDEVVDEDQADVTLTKQPSTSLPHHSIASSTFSSTEVGIKVCNSKSRKSRKRGAIVCGLPTVAPLSIVRKSQDSVGNLTWEEKLLIMSREQMTEQLEDDERVCDDALYQEVELDEQVASEQRGRSSSNSNAPFSLPPNLPLPPLPRVPQKSLQRNGMTQMRTCNSLTNAQKQSFSTTSTFPHHHSLKSTLPRSTTCPDLASIAGGYAY